MTYSFERKLERANQHLKALKLEVHRWLSSDPYSIIDTTDPETGENVFRIRSVGAAPEAISLAAGDAFHNLRSVLDHLTYALAVSYHQTTVGSPLAFGDIRDTQFPIFRFPKGFEERAPARIKRLHPHAQAIIKGLQPYQAATPVEHSLWFLKELDDVDKHRTLNLALAAHQGTSWGNPGVSRDTVIESMHVVRVLGPHEREAEIARYKAHKLGDKTARVKVNLRPVVEVAFAYPPVEGREVLATFEGIRDYILNEVIPPLRPFLL